MKLKLDENLGRSAQLALTDAGHEVSTVPLQHLGGALDEELIALCKREERALVTCDLDFANPLRFPPLQYPGIAVLRMPAKPSATVLDELVQTLAGALKREELRGHLWIVELGRLRIYQDEEY